jgi:PmbA protein
VNEKMSETMKSYVDYAVEFGTKQNVDLILGIGTSSTRNQIRFSSNRVDISKQWQSDNLELVVVVGGNQLAIGEFSPRDKDHVEERVNAQIKFAKTMSPSPFYQGVESTVKEVAPLVGHYDENIDDYGEKAVGIINSCIDEAINEGAKRVAGSYFFGKKNLYLNSSAGPTGSHSSTSYNLTIRAFQEELDASGQGLATGCIPHTAEKKLLGAAATAGRFSRLHKNAESAKPGTYDIIMSPAVAANLVGSIPSDANPLAVMMGRSALGDKMGEKLAPDFISISDNGLQPDGLGSSPFDDEGTPRQTTPIFKDGVLVSFIHSTSSAKMFQGESTGNGSIVSFWTGSKLMAPSPTNYVFDNGDHSFEELMETNRKCIYVTCNWYTRYTSKISTEYSTIPRDAAFLVENGELATPIKNFRISDNMLRQFANIDALGNDRVQVKWWEVDVPTWLSTLRIKDCRVTTATQ